MADVPLQEKTSALHPRQPKPPVHWLVYLVSDWLLTAVSLGIFRRGKKRW